MTEPFNWTPSDEQTYLDRLEALWPACNMQHKNMFLLGEPYDSSGDDKNPRAQRYLAHMRNSAGYWVGSRPVTITEFAALAVLVHEGPSEATDAAKTATL